MLYAHVPREPDELELVVGDYVYVSRESLQSSPDGWVEATSWLTGQSGHLPLNYIPPRAESDSWTLHRWDWGGGLIAAAGTDSEREL